MKKCSGSLALGCICIHRLEQLLEVQKCIYPREKRRSSVSSATDDSSVPLDNHARLIDIPPLDDIPGPRSEDSDDGYDAGISDFSRDGADTVVVDKFTSSGSYVGKYVIPAQRKPGQPGYGAKSKKVCKDQELKQSEPKPSPGKQEITNITNSQNTKRTYGQPSEQLFLERWLLINRNRTKNNMNKHTIKRNRNSDIKTGNREPL